MRLTRHLGCSALGLALAVGLATAAPAFRMSIDELVGHLPTLHEAAKALSALMALQ